MLEKFINKIFAVSTEEKINPHNGQRKVFTVYKFLFIKIKFNRAYSTNKIYKVDKNGNKKLVTNKKELFKYLHTVTGENNTIIIPDTNCLNITLSTISGNNNCIEIKNIGTTSNITIDIFASNSNIYIDSTSNFFACVHLRIDRDNKKIQIGKDCMFSYGVDIWTGDAHPIYDISTGERINEDKDVIIGNHVWIGRNASIHKGAVIPDGCIIGANSFVTKQFKEPSCIIAGIPAKIIKENVRWEPK